MPKTVIAAHFRKSHPAEKEENGETTINSVEEKDESVLTVEVDKDDLGTVQAWNAGKITTCSQCDEEWPSRLMPIHVKLRHGL